MDIILIGITLLLVNYIKTAESNAQCLNITNVQRLDCYPNVGSNENGCIARGCCWMPNNEHDGLPYCYFPKDYSAYTVVSTQQTKNGFIAQLSKLNPTYYADEIKNIAVEIREETSTRLRLRFTVPLQPNRWEPNIQLGNPDDIPIKNVQYKVSMEKSPFGLKGHCPQFGRMLSNFQEDVIVSYLQEKGLLRRTCLCDCDASMYLDKCLEKSDILIFRCRWLPSKCQDHPYIIVLS